MDRLRLPTLFCCFFLFSLLFSHPVSAAEYFLGAYYMPKPVMPSHQFFDLKTYNRMPTTNEERRKPLLGYYSGTDSTVVDWQNRWAKEAGLSYFIFDEYWTQSQETPVYNTSLKTFISAPLNNPLQFAVLITSIKVTNNDAQKASDIFINRIAPYMKNNYFTKSNYLKINGKPVVYIFYNPNVFGSDISPAWIQSRFQAFEEVVGTDIIWMYSMPQLLEPNYLPYKQMGYTALAPYYVAPGITGLQTEGNATTGIPYTTFATRAYDMNLTFFQKAADAGLAFIPSATTNFDERPRYPNEPWQILRSYTTNKQLSSYKTLLEQLKSRIDGYKTTNPSLLLNVDGKPMFNLGAWNEWVEDAQLEPGYAGLHPSDPYAVLKTVQTVFSITPTNLFTLAAPDRTPVTPSQTQWNFGNENDIRNWYILPSSTDIRPHSGGQYGTFVVDVGQSAYLEGTVSFNASLYKGIRLPYSAVCANQSTDCTESIQMTWFSTNCTSDTNGSCQNTQSPNKRGQTGLTLAGCTNKRTDAEWGYCDFIPSPTDPTWSGTIEQLRLVFFTKQKHPTYYSISTMQLLPKDTVTTPTVPVTPTPSTARKPGDANGDGKVDGIDYVRWLTHFKKQPTNGAADGDFNIDGKVDGIDYTIWLINFGK